jgi:segregation and condensation protein B
MTDPEDDLLRILEAMLFAAHESLSVKRMARALGHVREERVAQGVEQLRAQLDEKGSPLMLVEIAGGLRLVTRPEYAPFLARLFSKAERERLSSAALETLAIVAYRQPATRAEIEAVRGVQVSPLLKVLHERRLVKVVGRAEVVGRPLQYGTTRRFLDLFGLGSLEDLPKVFPGRDGPSATNGHAPPVQVTATNGNGHGNGNGNGNGHANGNGAHHANGNGNGAHADAAADADAADAERPPAAEAVTEG